MCALEPFSVARFQGPSCPNVGVRLPVHVILFPRSQFQNTPERIIKIPYLHRAMRIIVAELNIPRDPACALVLFYLVFVPLVSPVATLAFISVVSQVTILALVIVTILLSLLLLLLLVVVVDIVFILAISPQKVVLLARLLVRVCPRLPMSKILCCNIMPCILS